jgi:excinuclease UvrABC nuclease subunit
VAEDGQATIDGVTYTIAAGPELTKLMIAAAEELHFEQAARLRDQIKAIETHGSVSSEAQPVRKVGRDPRGKRRRRR